MNDCKVWKKLEETRSKHQSRLQLNQQTQKLLKREENTLMPTVFLQNGQNDKCTNYQLPAFPEVQGSCPVPSM